MGRLFWKIFLAFWLIQIIAAVGTGTVVWIYHQAMAEQDGQAPQAHRPDPFLEAAQAVLRVGGVGILRDFLRQRAQLPGPLIYAIDETGMEVLARRIPVKQLNEAENNPRRVSPPTLSSDGHIYRIYIIHEGRNYRQLPPPLGGYPMLVNRTRPPGPPSPTAPIIAGLIASLAFSAWLAWYLSRPIRHLRRAFDSMAEGRLDTRISSKMGKRQDELAALGSYFDRMAARVAELVSAQRRLLHDVSHELRSPLARLQAAVGLARQQPEKTFATLDRIERETERLDHLVDELLALSRLEAGLPGKQPERFDLNGVLAEIIEDARFEAAGKKIQVEYSGQEEALITGHIEQLHRALENVIRNALQYSPEGGTVSVKSIVDIKLNQLKVSICDSGEGVEASQLTAIFEPFFRAEQKKSTNGTGLGLAIARRAVQAHRGNIQARNRIPQGLCVEISLPLAKN